MLVLIVILIFLQDWRAMLIPATTVPVTIIGAFAAMAALGFTVNLSTLFAIVLAIGIVVDDAIVIVEGVAHHIERGVTPHDASIKAMDELFGPIIGITLVLMSVFIPAAFMPGLTGKMYAQFALVIAATALLSAVNAATLKPTQAALWMRAPVPPEKRNIVYRFFNRGYDALERGYTRLIRRMVSASAVSVVISLLIVAAGLYGLSRVASGFIPIEDQGYLVVAVQLPDGASLERTQKAMDQVAEIAQKTPGVDQVVTVAGISPLDNSASLSSAGVSYVTLKPWSQRGPGQDLLSLFVGMNKAMEAVTDARVLVVPPPPIQGVGNASGATMQIELRDGSFDFRKLQNLANAMVEAGTEPVELPAHDDDVPRRCAAVPHRRRPREGADAARQRRSGLLDHPDLPRIDLCGAVQQVRPHLPGLCAGRRQIPPAPGGHHGPDRAQQPGQHGADRHAGDGGADHRPAADQPL